MHFGRPGEGDVLQAGMLFTIELDQCGTVCEDSFRRLDGGTKDRSLSAQFEHSLAVTKDGYEVFTLSPEGLNKPPYDI